MYHHIPAASGSGYLDMSQELTQEANKKKLWSIKLASGSFSL
jgi:hypothetical protein